MSGEKQRGGGGGSVRRAYRRPGSSARWPESWPGGDAGGLLGGGGDVLLGKMEHCLLAAARAAQGRAAQGGAKGAGGSRREQKAHANRPHPSAMAHLRPGHGYQARLPPSRGRKGSARLPPAQKLSPSDLVRGLVASIGDGVAGGSHGLRVHLIFFPTGSAARRPLLGLCVCACLLPQTPRASLGAA